MLKFFIRGGWLLPSFFALFFWGLWSFLTKLGTNRVPWQTMTIYLGVCTFLVGLITRQEKFNLNTDHMIGLIAGLAGAIGNTNFTVAISRGQASKVIPITSLYVLVASILAFILLSEPLTLKKILGILCALAAMILLSG